MGEVPRLEVADLITTLLLAPSGIKSIAQADLAGGADGSSIDLGEDGSPALCVWDLGTASATTEFLPIWEDSDDDSDFDPVADAGLLEGAMPAITTANDAAIYVRTYIGGKRYLRASITDDDAGTAALIAQALIFKLHTLPAVTPYQLKQLEYELNRRPVPASNRTALLTLFSS